MIEHLELKLSGSIPVTREELFELVSSWGRKDSFETFDNINVNKCESNECYDLSNLDVSQIESLSFLFRDSYYNGDLSKWNIYNVESMLGMFSYSEFNNNSLKDWDLSNVEKMMFMFSESKFNGDISNWDVSNVEGMSNIFESSYFSGDISKWKFNKNVSCVNIFYNNDNFSNKYNDGHDLPRQTRYFLDWFENNRFKMKELNQGTKEEILNFFSFDNNLNKDIK